MDLLVSIGPLAVGWGHDNPHLPRAQSPDDRQKPQGTSFWSSTPCYMLASKYRGWRCHNVNNHANFTSNWRFVARFFIKWRTLNRTKSHPVSSYPPHLLCKSLGPVGASKFCLWKHLTTWQLMRCENAGHFNKSLRTWLICQFYNELCFFHSQLCQNYQVPILEGG